METLRLGEKSKPRPSARRSSRVRLNCAPGAPENSDSRWEISTRNSSQVILQQFFLFSGDLFFWGPVFWGVEIFATKQDFNSGKVESRMERWRGEVLEVPQEAKIDRLAEERRARRATSAGVGGKATRRAGDREARGVESNPSAAAIPKREPSRLETLTSSPHNPKPLSERVSENRETLGRQGGGGVGVFRRAAMDAGRS